MQLATPELPETTVGYGPYMDELRSVALTKFGLEIDVELPISESFSSAVLLFIATDGRRYVIKRPWAANKAEREAAALRALSNHPGVPDLLGIATEDGATYLLIEGIDATPWVDIGDASPDLLRDLGRSIGLIHSVPAESFDGEANWHELLIANADRYVESVGGPDHATAAQARYILGRHLHEVPVADNACLIHFDLRPGNVLVRDGQLVGVIDFESCRGGHGSMDMFKLWQQVAPFVPGGMTEILAGYVDSGIAVEPWMEAAQLDRLMSIYSAYHGLAGLSWCYSRNDFGGSFPDVNRNLIAASARALAIPPI